MTTEAALALLLGLIEAAVRIAGPLLAVSLTAGLIVGILQAATQLNEGSVSFVVKVTAVVATLLITGSSIAAFAVQYTRSSLLAIEHVVR